LLISTFSNVHLDRVANVADGSELIEELPIGGEESLDGVGVASIIVVSVGVGVASTASGVGVTTSADTSVGITIVGSSVGVGVVSFICSGVGVIVGSSVGITSCVTSGVGVASSVACATENSGPTELKINTHIDNTAKILCKILFFKLLTHTNIQYWQSPYIIFGLSCQVFLTVV
jgi:hypothetical protein